MDAAQVITQNEALRNRQTSFHHLRFVVIGLAGIAMGVMMIMRYSVAVAMVGMVNQTQLYINAHPNASRRGINDHLKLGQYETGIFDWNHEQQEKIISFYMLTYVTLQYYSTKTIARIGFRLGVCASIALCALFNALTPVVSYWGWQWAVVSRLAQGAAASGILPSMVSLIERWSTQEGAAGGVSLFQFIGSILQVAVPSIGGALASIHWKWAFYVPGVWSLLFCVLWYSLITDEPESSSIISQKELDLLKSNSISSKSSGQSNEYSGGGDNKVKASDISFLSILKIKEFYGLWITWSLWGATGISFSMVLPAYINSVFNVSVSQVGALASMAQIGTLFSMLWSNRATSAIMDTFGVDLTFSRKILVALCLVSENLSILAIVYLQSHQILLLNVDRFFHITFYTIFLATIMSQFKPHSLSGIIFSIVNSSACTAGTVVSVLVGRFLDHMGDTPETWSWIFMAAILLNTMYLVTYSLFCDSKPANLKSKKEDCSVEAKS